jgi:predicted TIM-barrel fold metal-dependent hydrolase
MTVYTPAIDLDTVVAIDMHAHVESDAHGHLSLDQELLDASAAYFRGVENRTPTVEDLADYYRARNMAAVVFTIDASSGLGHPALSSVEIAERAAEQADVLIPFGSVDPVQGDAAIEQARLLVERYGVRGFKFHPGLQAFAPNDPAFAPLWATLQELGAIALFHTGQTGIGAGLPGGRGIKLRFSDPLLLDDVAADFPQLPIVMAHPAVPWVDTQISIATHKANVFIDLSGWSPKYFPPQLVKQLNGPLRHKMLFGSDFPVITPDRWLADLGTLEIKDEVRPLLLKENAARLLGLRGGSPASQFTGAGR